MRPGASITIPHPLTFLPHYLPALHGGETGMFIAEYPSGLGEPYYLVKINGVEYPLREGEFVQGEKQS